MEIDHLCHLFDHLKVTEVSCVPCEDEDLLCHFVEIMEIDHLCQLFDQLSVSEVNIVSFEEEDLLCRLFGCLNISDVVLNIPTVFISSPSSISRSFCMDDLCGSRIISKDKGSGQPLISFQSQYWTQGCSGKLLLWKRQLQRDFYLFFSFSGVRKKNNWLAFGYFEDHQRWVGLDFYILWRYRSFEAASVFWLESSSIKLCCLIIFCADDYKRYLVNMVVSMFIVCVCGDAISKASCRDLLLHSKFLRQFEDFEETQFLLKTTREISCVVISGWFLRRVPDFFAKINLSLPTREIDLKLTVIVPFDLSVWVVYYLLMSCYKVGDYLLLEANYPNFDLLCRGWWEFSVGVSDEFNLHTSWKGWINFGLVAHLLLEEGSVRYFKVGKNLFRVVDHVAPIQTHHLDHQKIICCVVWMLLSFVDPVTSSGLWLQGSGYEFQVSYVNRLVCNVFYVLFRDHSCNL